MWLMWGLISVLAFGAQPQVDYSVGVAFAIEPDQDFTKNPGFSVRVTPEGKLAMLTPDRANTIEVQPRVSFVWGTDGNFRRSTVELGNQLSNKQATVSMRPTVVLGEDGKRWLIVPSSLLPNVNGFSPASIPGAKAGARDVLRAFDLPTRREREQRLFAPGDDVAQSIECVDYFESTPSVPAESLRVNQAVQLTLAEPMQQRDYVALRRAWTRFTADNPNQLQLRGP